MVPRTSSIAATPSPFASLLPQPASPPALKLPVSTSESLLSPLYGFPPTFPLMSTPGIHSLPFHKQALLSPLLAHTHLWQMARANPLLAASAAQRPELDLMAEHKALMERFAAAAMAAQTAAALSASASAAAPTTKEETKEEVQAASPPVSPKTSNSDEPPQNAPIDLSNKKSSDEEDSEEDMDQDQQEEKSFSSKNKKLVVRSDLNRNNILSSHQSGSEADEEDGSDEELDVGENLSR